MSIIRNFQCDLCKVQFTTFTEAEKHLVGIHFTSCAWVPKLAAECETHICRMCIKIVKQIPECKP